MHSISNLKQHLISSKALGEIWEYFFKLMHEGILLKNSAPVSNLAENDILRALLAAVQKSASQQLGRQVSVMGLMLSETPSEHFYQGTLSISDITAPAIIFYFSDIQMGSFAYTQNGQNELFRFSLAQVSDPKEMIRH